MTSQRQLNYTRVLETNSTLSSFLVHIHVFVVKILLITYVVVVMLQVGGLLKDQIRFMRIYRTIFNIEIQIVLI